MRRFENDFRASASSLHFPIPPFNSIINFLSVVWLILEKLLVNSVHGFPGDNEYLAFTVPVVPQGL